MSIQKTPEHDLSDLLTGIRKGDLFAFKKVVALYQDFVNEACFAVLRNKDQAIEAGSRVFQMLWDNRSDISSRTLIKTYLTMAAYEVCKAQRRGSVPETPAIIPREKRTVRR
ncbi:RNA polymerase sigma factor [Dinghuibacter silviterrae]|nr:hypothetical protein [Dinghuibacter silviterrae]